MDRSCPVHDRHDQGWRAMAMAVALFAITLNFLQPLAHAAMLRDGSPLALWSVFCNAAAADPDGTPAPGPMATQQHDCCLGLAHATGLIEPPSAFVLVEPVAGAVAPLLPPEQPMSVGIRDGPSQPRGPPLLV
jgi:hypothetical protein